MIRFVAVSVLLASAVAGDHVNDSRAENPFPMPVIEVDSAQEAYEKVLAKAGAVLPVRDAVDQRAVRQVRSGKPEHGDGIIKYPAEVGGYPEYKGEAVTYTQNDGIPDWWKRKYHLDVNDAELAAKDADGDGYTTVEEYLKGRIRPKRWTTTIPRLLRQILSMSAVKPTWLNNNDHSHGLPHKLKK